MTTTRGDLTTRAAGVLLHPTSLPGGQGIGDVGPEAHRWIAWLQAAGQRWWQMLPIHPPDRFGSPYASPSAFAGSPLLISLEVLVRDGWLSARQLPPARRHARRVNYRAVTRTKETALRQAYARFHARRHRRPGAQRAFAAFRARSRCWLPDFALFCALKTAAHGQPWSAWDAALRHRRPRALADAKDRLRQEWRYHMFVQWLFDQQWSRLQAAAHGAGIGLIGDLPIFVAHDSADVWAHQAVFDLNRHGQPRVVAGVPPDYFSANGQLWGNPVYRWARMRQHGYAWWRERLRVTFRRFDAVRLDHFIGFHRYWAVPSGARTARPGRYRAGPGAHFFQTMRRNLGPLPMIAEDLGTITPAVRQLRDQCGFPGMRVLQFAFGDDPEARLYQPHRFPRRCVVYTGTHDNDTTVGWFHDSGSRASTRSQRAIRRERAHVVRYVGHPVREIHWDMIRLAYQSVADTAIIPAQDVLGLDSRARMNLPGTLSRNWQWRLRRGQLSAAHARRVRAFAYLYGRHHTRGAG